LAGLLAGMVLAPSFALTDHAAAQGHIQAGVVVAGIGQVGIAIVLRDGGGGVDTLVLTATAATLNTAVDGQLFNVEAISAATAGAAVAMAFVPNVWWAVVVSIPMGVGGAGFLAIGNALSQLRTPGEMRSRMLALVAVAFLGSTPIGGPITGLIADIAGSEWALAYGGLLTLAAAVWGSLALSRAPVPSEKW
jgi:MFS family permease